MSQTIQGSRNTTKSDDPCWFVAYVKSCQEYKTAEALAVRGYQYYLPVIKELRQWSDRKKVVNRLVLPHMIFVWCRPSERVRTLAEIRTISAYMVSRGPHTPVVVPEDQMKAFRSMVDNGGREVRVTDEELAPGDRVRVVSGPLSGLECELVSVSGRRCLAVRMGLLGAATMELASDTLEKIKE